MEVRGNSGPLVYSVSAPKAIHQNPGLRKQSYILGLVSNGYYRVSGLTRLIGLFREAMTPKIPGLPLFELWGLRYGGQIIDGVLLSIR